MLRRNVLLWAVLLTALPATGIAQSDLCIPSPPLVPVEARSEQLRIDATERAQRELDRKGWEVKMFQVKKNNFCLFHCKQPLCHR